MKVCVSFPVGCPRAEFDAFLVLEYLKANGCAITREFSEADIILISGCAVTKRMEERTKSIWSIISNRKKPNAEMIYYGCYSGIVDNYYGEMAIKGRNFKILDDILNTRIKFDEFNKLILYFSDGDVVKGLSIHDKIRIRFNNPYDVLWNIASLLTAANKSINRKHIFGYGKNKLSNIKIANGCNGSCTYCAIKRSSEPLRSNNLSEIVWTFRRVISTGHTIIRLIAEDVGAYGQDCGTNIVSLFKELYSISGDFQIIIEDFSPLWLISYFSELLEIFSHAPDRLIFLGIPIQSGSNRILKLMRRGYDAHDAKRCLRILRETFPKMRIHTHIMIGFPGENSDDFNDTLNILHGNIFNRIQTYKYCDRPGTISSHFPDKVNEYTKIRRLVRLINTFGLNKISVSS